jgi:urea transporter
VSDQKPGSPLDSSPAEWIKIVLRGVGQVMFQENALTGLLFVIGIFAADWEMGLGAVIGSVIGTLAAVGLRYDAGEIRAGIYGFNATLVGIATFFFLPPTATVIGMLVVGCAVSSVVTWAARRFLPFPTYTGPFIVTTWVILAIASSAGISRIPHPTPPETLDLSSAVLGMFEGLAEVMLQVSWMTSLAFLAGLAVSNPRHATLGLIGSIVGTLVAIYHHDVAGDVSIGIYGYNATLTAIALYLWRKSLLIPLLGAILSTPITEFFPQTGLATLTAPFVLASWIVIGLGLLEPVFIERPLIAIDPDPSAATPE